MNLGMQQFTFNAEQERFNNIERKHNGLFSNLFGKSLKATAVVVQGEGNVLEESNEVIKSHDRSYNANTSFGSDAAEDDDFDFNPRGSSSSSNHVQSSSFVEFVSPKKSVNKTRVDTPVVQSAIRSNYGHGSKAITANDLR